MQARRGASFGAVPKGRLLLGLIESKKVIESPYDFGLKRERRLQLGPDAAPYHPLGH
ncbi:hypothetical protein GCM10027062_42920 [Nocardioides hungaricus]